MMGRSVSGHSRWIVAISAILAILVVLSALACKPLFHEGAAKLEIRLTYDRGAKTLKPEINLDIAAYDIHGTGPNGAQFDASNVSTASYVQAGLVPGEWAIYAEGKNTEDAVVVRSQTEIVTLSLGETKSLSLLCVPLEGTGMLSFHLNWPADIVIQPEIEAALSAAGKETQNLAFAINGNNASYSSAGGIATGCYTLVVKLKDAGRGSYVVWSKVETVMIYKDKTTSADWQLTVDDTDSSGYPVLVLGLRSDTKAPLQLDLAGSLAELSAGSAMTVSGSGSPAPTSWQWFLDGNLLAGETSASVTLGEELAPGSAHTLAAIGTLGDIAGSVETRFRIKMVSVATLAGSGSAGATDGIGAAASFSSPLGAAVDGQGNVYVADTGNHKIRKVSSSGVVSTGAGTGYSGTTDSTALSSQFNFPNDLALDASGNIYVADTANNKIRKITPQGMVSTLAGSGSAGSTDGTGTSASFNAPSGVAVDALGNIYVADTGNNKIRKVTPAGVVTTIAGLNSGGFADGSVSTALFSQPSDIAIDESETLFIADTGNNRIRKISGGQVSTVAGSGEAGSADGFALQAAFNYPTGIAVDAQGYLYVADSDGNKIRKITPAGRVITLAGSQNAGYAHGPWNIAFFNYPARLAIDQQGTLFIPDANNNAIRKVTQ
ncbi:MAG: NHL repeat-containing protein [Rectinema subterraneum]|uniref:NHL repeat-containing protein n=1 Tax=Rectinema subterraneum TaxID=2653714 RepID=UPI003C7B98CF